VLDRGGALTVGAPARTVLVTGAAGFVGRRVSRALAAAGWRVTGLDCTAPPEGATAFADFRTCNLLDDTAVTGLTAEFAAVVHLAGLLPGAGRGPMFAVNVGGTSAVLEHAAGADTHVVLLSTGLVYGQQPAPFVEEMTCAPRDPYAQSKLAAEAVVGAWSRATSGTATLLRPSVLYGADAAPAMLLVSLMRALRKEEPFAMTAGEQLRDFLHVDDAAGAIVGLLERRQGGTFNLASGESRTVREVAELSAVIAGRRHLLRIGALPYRPGEVFDYRLAPAALREAIDWQPRIGLADGLRQLWQELA
jgi:nucleoside-diphosphate-sugar epimerase